MVDKNGGGEKRAKEEERKPGMRVVTLSRTRRFRQL